MGQSRSSGFGVFGLVAILIVVAVVMYLSAQSAKTSVPILTGPVGGDQTVSIEGETQSLRGLDHMKSKTDDYTSKVNSALKEIEESEAGSSTD